MNEPLPLTQCKPLNSLEFKRLPLKAFAMEPKIDGWRIQMEVTEDQCFAWTRTQHDASGKLVKPEDELKRVAKYVGNFRLDGEVVYLDPQGNPDFNFTSRCMGSHTETCIWKQEEEERYLSYVVFDLLMHGDQDLRRAPFEKRRDALEALLPDIQTVPLIDMTHPSEFQHQANIDRFKEGSVLKQLNSPYAGKRHKSWLKWKAEETLDVKIIGYKEGEGKYTGLIGAITFRASDGTTGNCSGMDDDTRVYISNNRETLKGTLIEIKHYGLLVDSFRHPQFVRFRTE